MREPVDAIANIALGDHDGAPDLQGYGYLQFPWVAALHRMRWRITRFLMIAGVIVVLPALLAWPLGLPAAHAAWLLPGIHPLSFLCIMALAGAMALHRPMRRPHPLKRKLLWLVLGVSLGRLVLPLMMPRSEDWLPVIAAALQPARPAEMGMNTAIGLAVIAAALLTHRARPTLASVLAAFAPMPAVLALTGYLYDVPGYYGQMSPGSIVAQLLLSFCALSILSHRRTFRTLLSNGLLGRLVRLQLMLGGATPFVVGWVFLHEDGRGDLQILALTLMVWLVSAMVLLTMREHERADYRRRLLERRMLALSALDPLTGVASRRGATFLTARLLRSAQERRESLSVLMIDLDHFKSINDRFGHDMGDKVLVRAARLFERRLRSTDGLARWGGEEFVAVLPGTGQASAAVVGEALRRLAAERLAEGLLPPGERVTASIGCAEVWQGELSIQAAITRADAALYRAKGEGRNRVCQAEKPAIPDPALPAELPLRRAGEAG